MKIFILGGTGFLGYHATHELLQRGHSVRTLALPPLTDADILPPEVEIHMGDFNQLSDDKILRLFDGCEGVIFSAGADDRVTPKAPAYPFFYKANVLASTRFFKLAKAAGVKRGVLLGSYFAHFDQVWPELELSAHHPYIRSRVEQEAQCLKVAGNDLNLAILELPYIFGQMPGRTPLWKPLVKYLHWPLPWIFYPRGGTAMVSVRQVALAIAGAIELDEGGGRYLIGDENLTWQEFLTRLCAAANLKKRIITLPDGLVKAGLWIVKGWHTITGREGGLDPSQFIKIQTRETYFDPLPAIKSLGFCGGDLDDAFKDTIIACGYE